MAVITKIEEQKNKKRFNIFVDDAFFCGLNKETAVIFGLKVGKEIEISKLEQAVQESEIKSAFEKAIDYISIRMHTKQELFEKLLKKGYEKEIIEKAIEKLEDYGYINDEAYAKAFFSENKKYSKRVIENKLKQKGISNEIISRYASDISVESQEILCENQARKYMKGKDLETSEEKQKLYASLARKGFEFDLIKKVCKKVLGESNEDFLED